MQTCDQNKIKEPNQVLAKIVKSSHREKTKIIKIKTLMSNGANINFQDKKGNTLLHLASSASEVSLLLKLGADVHIQNFAKEIPILHIIKQWRCNRYDQNVIFKRTKPIIRELLKYYFANINCNHWKDRYIDLRDSKGRTPVSEYIYKNECNIRIVKLLIEIFGWYENYYPDGNSLLHLAVKNPFCKVGVVKYLIKLGFCPKYRNFLASTPLHCSVKKNNIKLDIVQELLKYNTDVMQKDLYYSSLSYAVLNASCNKELLKILLHGLDPSSLNEEVQSYGSILHAAMTHMNIDVIEMLITFGAKINATNSSGLTPLHLAVSKPHCDEKIISLLLKHGADVNCKDENNQTPLHMAFKITANMNVIKTLLLNKAEMCVTDKKGYTPFHYLIENHNIQPPFWNELLFSNNSVDAALELTAKCQNFLYISHHKSRIHLAKHVLKYLILKNRIEKFMKFIPIYFKTLYSYLFSPPLLFEIFCAKLIKEDSDFDVKYFSFYRQCMAEVECMKNDILLDQISLYSVMVERFSQLTSSLDDKDKKHVIDAVIARKSSNQYPIYKDMIMFSLWKQDFLISLDAIRFSSTIEHCDGLDRMIYLYQYPVRHIAKFLSNEDIVNLILAYSNNDDNANVNYSLKNIFIYLKNWLFGK